MKNSRVQLATRVHWVRSLNLVYMHNAKSACSTIKKSLWVAHDYATGRETYAGNPNDRKNAPFSKNIGELMRDGSYDEFLSSTFFSVVRNPYVRVLSTYLNKIHKNPRDAGFWRKFTTQFGLSQSTQLGFPEFISLITEEKPELLDWHLCPQYVNLLYPIAPLDFIGRLEEMDQVVEFLSEQGVKARVHIPHHTSAKRQIDAFYSKKEAQIVSNYYEKDFELYGYSEDLTRVNPVRKVKPDPSREQLIQYLQPART